MTFTYSIEIVMATAGPNVCIWKRTYEYNERETTKYKESIHWVYEYIKRYINRKNSADFCIRSKTVNCDNFVRYLICCQKKKTKSKIKRWKSDCRWLRVSILSFDEHGMYMYRCTHQFAFNSTNTINQYNNILFYCISFNTVRKSLHGRWWIHHLIIVFSKKR